MKRIKFNQDYCGEILLIGFTGDYNNIRKYLLKVFNIKYKGKHSLGCNKTKFNLEVAPSVIAHIEPYSNINRDKLKLKEKEW